MKIFNENFSYFSRVCESIPCLSNSVFSKVIPEPILSLCQFMALYGPPAYKDSATGDGPDPVRVPARYPPITETELTCLSGPKRTRNR